MDTIYVVRAEGTDCWKVGRTQVKVSERVNQLQTACPHTLKIYETFHSDRSANYEAVMHEILDRRAQESLEGEWFRATQGTIGHAIEKTQLQGASNEFWSEAHEAFSEEARVSFNRWRHQIWEHGDAVRSAMPIQSGWPGEPDAEWVRENPELVAERLQTIQEKVNTLMKPGIRHGDRKIPLSAVSFSELAESDTSPRG